MGTHTHCQTNPPSIGDQQDRIGCFLQLPGLKRLPPQLFAAMRLPYRDILSRADILESTGLAWSEIELVLAHLVSSAMEVNVRYLWRPNLVDEADNFILEIAVAAWPCTIVTHNLKDFKNAQLRFPQIDIITPGQLLNTLTH